jgi:D-lactate dehydrogenase (cytochrome)
VIETFQYGLPVARVERMDPLSIHPVNIHSEMNLPERPALFFEVHGAPAAVNEQVAIFDALQRQNGRSDLRTADRLEERDRLSRPA